MRELGCNIGLLRIQLLSYSIVFTTMLCVNASRQTFGQLTSFIREIRLSAIRKALQSLGWPVRFDIFSCFRLWYGMRRIESIYTKLQKLNGIGG